MKSDKRIFLVKEIACANVLWDRQHGQRAEIGWTPAHGDMVVKESRSLVVSE